MAGLGTLYLARYCLRQPLTATRWFGLAMALVSFALWLTARVQIGASFSIAPKATALVTRGIYSRIRNPIYVFSATWLAGLVLALGRPLWLLALVWLIPMQVARARREAQVLAEKFGEAYHDYRRRTWF